MLWVTIFQRNLAYRSNFMHDTDEIDSCLRLSFSDFFQTCECSRLQSLWFNEVTARYRWVIINLFDFSVAIKDETMFILSLCVFRAALLDYTLANLIADAYDENILEHVNHLSEKCALHSCTFFVDEF